MAFGTYNPSNPNTIASQIVNAAIAAGFTPPNIGSDYDKALIVLANAIPAFPLRLAFGGGVADTIFANFTALNSPAGGTPTLMSTTFPATTFNGTGVGLSIGLLTAGWGTFANNAAAKTVKINLGTSGSETLVNTITATASQANAWFMLAFTGITSNAVQTNVAFGYQGTATPTSTAGVAGTTTNLTSGVFSVLFNGTQTSAADIIQNGLVVVAL